MSEPNQKHHPLPPVIGPGPCPIDANSGLPICPPPREIDIIKVSKIFAECMHTEVDEAEIVFNDVTGNVDILVPQCGGIEIVSQSCTTNNNDLVKVSVVLNVLCNLNSLQETTEITMEKTFKVARASEAGLTANCYIYPECLQCFISSVDVVPTATSMTVTCCVGILILIKLEAEVQLLIPTYGYAPQPPECTEVTTACPAVYVPNWPPYPPQNRPPLNSGQTGNCQNC